MARLPVQQAYRRKTSLSTNHAAIAYLLFASSAAAQDPATLEAGRPITRGIRSGEQHRYQVSARTAEFVRGSLRQEGIEINIKGYFPDGSKIRSFAGGAKGSKVFRFVAETSGVYQLELTGLGAGQGEGRYTISLEPIQPMTQRLSIAIPEAHASPRIGELEKQLAAGDKEALRRFWDSVKQQGTPLFEKIPNDPAHELVTFLWQATFEIHNVLVLWTPFATEQPEDYRMRRLRDSDLWYKTLRVPAGARFIYQLSPNDTLTRAPNAQRYATAQTDPLNPRRQPSDPNITKYEISSIAQSPAAAAQPWSAPLAGVAKGQLHKHRLSSATLGNERDVTVYTPAGYESSGAAYPMLLLFDGETYLSDVPAPVVLDNLIAERRIPAMLAILVGNVSSGSDQRGGELFANRRFAEFIATEVVPWAGREYRVAKEPSRNVIGGLSAGGFAAAYVALHHPELFGRVLSQSGAFWWSPDGQEPAWLSREYISALRLPLRFYLEAGLFEGDILSSNRRFRDVLRAKGYEVIHTEFPGGHDRINWRGTLADALVALSKP